VKNIFYKNIFTIGLFEDKPGILGDEESPFSEYVL